MNFEQQDNLLLADWTFQGSLLCREAEVELKQLEELLEESRDLYARGLIQAVLWIQKVPYSDFCDQWLDELQSGLLRDEVRWRLGRLYCIRKAIQESPFPWMYLTEHDCLGMLAELMFACQRRFVFDTETRFGFPEMILDQLPAAGWLSLQIHKKPKLLEIWRRQNIWKAEEAVQFGLVDAALSWKDWRLEMFPWAKRQIEMWELESPARVKNVPASKALEKLWPERITPIQMKTQIDAYTERASRRLEAQAGVDAELIDSVAHFIFQAPYEAWLRRGLRSQAQSSQRIRSDIVYFEISESLPPVSMVSKLLDSGTKVVFFSAKSETLKLNLESMFGQLESKYRRHALQLFERQISWYVGPKPRQPAFVTISFGFFRDVTLSFREWEVRGWVLSHQKMERQAVELSVLTDRWDGLSLVKQYFETVYSVKNFSSHTPLLYIVKSLALQILIQYARLTGEGFDSIIEQLQGTEWKLIGSQSHWDRFLKYRASLQTLSQLSLPEKLGKLPIEREFLGLHTLDSVREAAFTKRAFPPCRGPGYLHNYMSAFARMLIQELLAEGCLENEMEASIYVTDALGYPPSWGGVDLFSRRIGIRVTDESLLSSSR